ncbi:MAG: lysophospholipid acyltransferase family protein [Acidimicrobiales bacterium]
MTVDPDQQTADIRRFYKWARRVRRLGHLLRKISYHPADLEPGFPQRLVMVANHRSLSDVFVAVEALAHYQLPARCLVRAKYFETPGAGRFLRTIGCIPAGDGKRASIDIAKETLEADRPVAVMIEGKIVPPERRAADGLGDIRPGFVEIARAANADILPIALVNTEHIWRSRGKFPRLPWRGRAKVEVHTGKIVTIEGRSDDEIIAETRKMIAEYLAIAEA